MRGLGRRQRRMLVDISTHGGWPPGWRLSFDDRTVLASLHRAELVTEPGRDVRLTSAGFLVAATLRGGPL